MLLGRPVAVPFTGKRLGDTVRCASSSFSAFPLGFRVERERVSAPLDDDIVAIGRVVLMCLQLWSERCCHASEPQAVEQGALVDAGRSEVPRACRSSLSSGPPRPLCGGCIGELREKSRSIWRPRQLGSVRFRVASRQPHDKAGCGKCPAFTLYSIQTVGDVHVLPTRCIAMAQQFSQST